MDTSRQRAARALLLASVAAIATCGLIYELVAGTLASYLLGDSVTQFSTVIGTYLCAMGLGSWMSKYVPVGALAMVFVEVELLLGLIGGFSAALLFWLFPQVTEFRFILYSVVTVCGALVGLEIPLLLRLLKDELKFEDLVSQVLSLDYVGALAASLLFPLILVPKLGLIKAALLFGILNALVGVLTLWLLRHQIRWIRSLVGMSVGILALLVVGWLGADKLLLHSEQTAYGGSVIHAVSTPYQRIVLSRQGPDLRLLLNGNLQFSSRDEYRYHEALVHPAMASHPAPQRILIMGGGDGLAVREILRYPTVQAVTLVDLDPGMTQLFQTHPALTALNQRALLDPRVSITNADAFTWLAKTTPTSPGQASPTWDVVIIDFPDPSNFSLGKLYSVTFYERLQAVLNPHSVIVIQSSSPLLARKSFWCTAETVEDAGYTTEPYHCYVPSFGQWGFIMARPTESLAQALRQDPAAHLPPHLQYLDAATLREMKHFPLDMARVPVGVNRLNNQLLVRYFEAEWGKVGGN